MAADDIATKQCTKCGEAKALSLYHRSSKGGLRGACKACCHAETKRNREKNPERAKQARREHYLKYLDRHKEVGKLWRDSNSERMKEVGRLWYLENKERLKKIRAEYRRKNKDKIRAYNKELYENNKPRYLQYWHTRRARKMSAGGKITPEDVKWLLEKQKGKCPVCKKALNEYHIDHIVALSRGGSNDRSNAQLLHPTCNLKKATKDPVEFMQEQGFLL